MLTFPFRITTEAFRQRVTAHWIVLTGGPCSGKSTLLSLIQRELTSRGFRVLVLEEAATRSIMGGVNFQTYGADAMQRHIVLSQISMELITQDLMENGDYNQYVIICDRGILDGAAYVGKETFSTMLQDWFQVTLEDVRANYDMVIHLVTAADGAEDFYKLDNPARKESPEEAKDLDKATQNAWMGHHNYHIVGNQGILFEEKQERVLNIVYEFLGQPIPLRTYRKYLVNLPSIEILKKQTAYTKVDILRYYLPDRPDHMERSVTRRSIDGQVTYYYSERRYLERESDMPGADGVYVERQITEKEFNESANSHGPVREHRKTRHCFTSNNRYYELDEYPNSMMRGQGILKIHPTTKENTYEIPYFFKTLTVDVTNQNHYKSIFLSNPKTL